MDIGDKLESIRQEFLLDMSSVESLEALAQVKVKFLGKKGVFRELADVIRSCPEEDRPSLGAAVNGSKEFIQAKIEELGHSLAQQVEVKKLESEKIDISLPGEPLSLGGEHVLKKTLRDFVDIFVSLGFSVREAPNIESEANNFSLLNFSENHPARQMHDTFYLDPKTVLRTHTSNVQVREMKKGQGASLKIVAPGICFRNEDISARSHTMFHQIEAFHLGENISIKDLIAVLQEVFRLFFNKHVQIKFRHSYFPFVEPGVEVDVSCIRCEGSGCMLCKESGWLEVAGAGMIHPEVLRNGNYDPEKVSGYALGMGIERLVMLKHGIPDIRLFFENDPRFLEQFYGRA